MTVVARYGDEYPITFVTTVNIAMAVAVQLSARLEGTGTPIVLPSTITGDFELTHDMTGTLPVGRYSVTALVTWVDAGPVSFGVEYLEVLPAALPIPFATPAQLSEYTAGAIAADDPRSALVLAGATAAIRAFCGWHIAPAQDFTLTLDGDGGTILFLPSLKVNSVSVLDDTNPDGVVTDLSGVFELSARTGNLRLKDGWRFSDVWGGVTVTFNSGYDQVPAAITQLTLQIAAMALSSPTGATREQAGQVAMSWATTSPGVAGGLTLLARDYTALSPYVLPKEV